MALLEDVKLALRISSSAFDIEVEDLIKAARQDLILSGVSSEKVNTDDDPLIKRAITVYCKAHFGYEDPIQAERFMKSYEALKTHIALSREYTEVTP